MDIPVQPEVPEVLDWRDDPLWFKDAIVYELHVKTFYDSNGDGIGDLRGLTEKLDYLQELGVNTLWLLPFYPSPLKDDGYDIADYRNIHTDLGTRADFRTFIREAHRRGLKVITELVINHTSDQHPWFQAARRAPPGSPKRDFYIWSDDDKRFPETRIIFTDTERSNWAWDEVAQAYYWHRFFSHQPDLNHNNPDVVKAVIRIMRFWLDCGVDGLRLDAIPYLCVREGTNNENLPETHDVIKQMRAVIDEKYRNRMLLAEANQWPEDVREYFGEGDECHMAYHFPLMPRVFMAVAREDRHPIVEIMRQTPEIPDNCQWAIFLRNHDELTLEMVTDRERDYLYQTYATEPRMRVNVGIRRRLAPLMDNDRGKIELVNFILMTMPGSPFLYYGDEIGMGDNIYLGDRNGVRTPMQWSPDRNGGFSRADPQRLYLPPVMDPLYGYESVNVEAQRRNLSSLLSWTKRLIAVRKNYKAFGRGSLTLLEPGNRKILAYVREWGEELILCVVNLSRNAQPVELDLSDYRERVPVELMGRAAFPPIGDLPYLLTVSGYGYYAFRLALDADVPYWHEERLPRSEMPVLVLTEGWLTLAGGREGASAVRRAMSSRTSGQFTREVLVPYLTGKRWFAGKAHPIEHVEIRNQAQWNTDAGSWMLTVLEVRFRDVPPQVYFLPLAVAWEDTDGEDRLNALAPWTLARVRTRARVGILYGAFGDEQFCRALVRGIGNGLELPFANGRAVFRPTQAFAGLADGVDMPVHHPALEQSNTSVIFGDRLFLKAYRRLHEGSNPEVEIGRFLTETSPFERVVPVAGSIELHGEQGEVMTLALLQAFAENQGSAWNYAVDALERDLTAWLAQPDEPDDAEVTPGHELTFHLSLMTKLGARTAELHRAFARPTGLPDFEPEPFAPEDVRHWREQLLGETVESLDRLEAARESTTGGLRDLVDRLLDRRQALLDEVRDADLGGLDAVRTRYHSDYHLGQALLCQDDFLITDFEGEPARTLEERRSKHSALRDVAGMLRSLSYAAAVAAKHATSENAGALPEATRRADDWERESARAFLEGYREAIGDCAVMPSDARHAETLIRLFVLEKALYELRYELDNRPQWLDIPARGLLKLLEHEG